MAYFFPPRPPSRPPRSDVTGASGLLADDPLPLVLDSERPGLEVVEVVLVVAAGVAALAVAGGALVAGCCGHGGCGGPAASKRPGAGDPGATGMYCVG